MYSDNKVINMLTSLLLKHGVRHAVLCPGSRNAPICHNIKETGEIKCYPVTDERSAGFFAIGVSQATELSPVVVCVTSGSAILDVAPAVAEAFYQQIPLIVIAADRPAAWIGQLDGQTMPQPDAFGKMVKRSVSLPAGNTYEELWHANRLINEAMMDANGPVCGPVLINVPLSEPLYEFHKERLPKVRVCKRIESEGRDAAKVVAEKLSKAARPLVVFGQLPHKLQSEGRLPVLGEALSGVSSQLDPTIHVLQNAKSLNNIDDFHPDLIVYAGGNLVSKEAKQFLRSCTYAETILISPDGELHDVFQNTTLVAHCSIRAFIDEMNRTEYTNLDKDFCNNWIDLFNKMAKCATALKASILTPEAPLSQLAVFHVFAPHLEKAQIANSTSIRLADVVRFEHIKTSIHQTIAWGDQQFHFVYCNRGINGIDGCLSTAAGFSAADTSGKIKLCVIGDLSFFYDQNALWNTNIDGRLRILLLNNGGGGIFSRFNGLRNSQAKDDIVMAKHHTTAKGICEQNNVEYRTACDYNELMDSVDWLATRKSNTNRPRLLEVFTDMDTDARALKEYYDNLVSGYDKL